MDQSLTRKWQAESLVKRLPSTPPALLISQSLDLQCHDELKTALQTLYESKRRQMRRVCSEGFADFASEVDEVLYRSTVMISKERETWAVRAKKPSALTKKTDGEIESVRQKLIEVREEKERLELVEKWSRWREEAVKANVALRAIELANAMADEMTGFKDEGLEGFVTDLRLWGEEFVDGVAPKQTLDGLGEWMRHVIGMGRSIGEKCLERDLGVVYFLAPKSKQCIELMRIQTQIDDTPVKQYFAVHEATHGKYGDAASVEYAKQRVPSWRQSLEALKRMQGVSDPLERAGKAHTAFCEICGFFIVEKKVGVLSKGEMFELWNETEQAIVEFIVAMFPKTSGVTAALEDEACETVACGVARLLFALGTESPIIMQFFKGRMVRVQSGWVSRSRRIIRMHLKEKYLFYDNARLEIDRAENDVHVLETFFGSFDVVISLGPAVKNNSATSRDPRVRCAKLAVDEALLNLLTEEGSSTDDATFVFRTARDFSEISLEFKMCFAETEILARERIQSSFVTRKIDEVIRFEEEDWTPTLTTNTKFGPHPCVSKALRDVEASFSPTEDNIAHQDLGGEISHLAREAKTSLLEETISRLALALEAVVFRESPALNPVSLKTFQLDVESCETTFPGFAEKFSNLSDVLALFCVDGALDTFVSDASFVAVDQRERVVAVLMKFTEMDAASRLFAPAALRRRVVDLRENDVKRILRALVA